MDNDKLVAHLVDGNTSSLDPAERDEVDGLRQLLTDPAVWAEPPASLQERVVAAIADVADARPLRLAEGPEPAGRPAHRAGVTHRRSRRIAYTLLGAAAAAVLAVGLAVGLSGHGSRSIQFAASLGGTKLSPGASGHVTLTQTASGWNIQLRASGLPRRDNGDYYQAWLKSSAGVLVPIGTFNQPAHVTLWAGVAPSSYPTLTVTRQVANGDQASSGQVVLVGSTRRIH